MSLGPPASRGCPVCFMSGPLCRCGAPTSEPVPGPAIANVKADAWDLVASWAEMTACGDFDVSDDVRAHVLKAVVPFLRCKAAIIRRNHRRRP